jgi:hypothetical protein
MMRTWKSQVFGYSRLNFYGWMVASVLVNGGSVLAILRAVQIGALRSPSSLMLLGIYFVLLGQFNMAHQTYCARVTRSIEREDAKEKEEKK